MNINITVNARILTEDNSVLRRILINTEKILMASQQLSDAIARINTVTNDIGAGVAAVGAKVQTLLDTIASGATAEEVAAAAAALTGSGDTLAAFSANLTAIAADPADPVPPEAEPAPVEG